MRVTTPPGLGAGAALDGWGIRRAARRRFDHPATLAADPAHAQRLAVYTNDMLQAYGESLAPDAVAHGRGQSYGEMAEAILGDLVGPDDAVDVLVLAYAVPDIAPGRAVAVWLSHICPGAPMAFGLCDQGTGAAFTGLRMIRDYAASGMRTGVLIVVEQGEVPYGTDLPVPKGHAAVGFLFGDGDAVTRVDQVRQRSDAEGAPPEVGPDETLIVGTALGGPGGQPYTGVWWALAEEIEAGAGGRIVLADFDPDLKLLSVATVGAGLPVPS